MSEFKVEKSKGKWRAYEISQHMGKTFKTLIASCDTKQQAIDWTLAVERAGKTK